jgi:hypothetical protein
LLIYEKLIIIMYIIIHQIARYRNAVFEQAIPAFNR